MSLTFLSPWVLAGLASLAIPIAIHLILRRKPKHQIFPAFRFLRERRRTNSRRLQLRHLLLLALRLLLLAAVTFALARPLLSGGPRELAGNPDIGLVLVFDSSVSMAYVQDGKARIDVAKELASAIIDQLTPASLVAVLDSGEQGSQFLPSRDAQRLVQARRILPRNRPVTTALEDAWRLLESAGPKMPLFLCVFSDRTAASWDQETANLLRKLPELETQLERPIKTIYFDLGAAEPRNISVTGLSLRSGGGSTTPLEEVRLGAAARTPVQLQAAVEVTGASVNTELLLYLDGALHDRQALQAAAEPGQVTKKLVTFRPMTLTGSAHSGEVRLRGTDALEEDNLRYWTLTVSRRRVLIIADDPDDALDWKIALEVLDEKLPVECSILRPSQLPAVLQPDQYQAVCLFAVRQPSKTIWETLNKYVAAGGGLILLPGSECELADWNSEAALEVSPARLQPPRTVPGAGAFMIPDYDHPMMHRLKVWEQSLTSALIFRYWPAEILAGNLGVALAEYSDGGGPALVERLFDRTKILGRVLLFTTPMYRRTGREWKDWNNFLQESGGAGWVALALPYLAVEYVLGARGEATNFLLGEELRFLLPSGRKVAEYNLTGPQAGAGKVPEGASTLLLTDVNRPGNYQVADAVGKQWSVDFSVNLSARETNLQRNRPEVADIESALGTDSVRTWNEEVDLQSLVREQLGQASETDLLPWLMMLGLVLLAAENFLANRFYREDAEAST